MPILSHNPYGQSETYTVRTYDIDAEKRITVPALVRLMQEAAMQNVIRIKMSVWDLEEHDLSWVLLRKQLHIDRLPRLGEQLRIDTYPAGFDGLFTFRDYRVFDEDGNNIAHSGSRWMLMNLKKRRPARLPQFVRESVEILADEDGFLQRPDRQPLGRPSHDASVAHFRVKFHDLDFNLHLNNTYYIQWMLDALPRSQFDRSLNGLDIEYLQEARYDDRLFTRTEKGPDPNTYCHQLLREEDETELARALTRWH